ncbi:hypothetical protein MRX96_004972 [Rhipicephalus microplus]
MTSGAVLGGGISARGTQRKPSAAAKFRRCSLCHQPCSLLGPETSTDRHTGVLFSVICCSWPRELDRTLRVQARDSASESLLPSATPETGRAYKESEPVLIVLAVACAAAHAGFIGGGHGGWRNFYTAPFSRYLRRLQLRLQRESRHWGALLAGSPVMASATKGARTACAAPTAAGVPSSTSLMALDSAQPCPPTSQAPLHPLPLPLASTRLSSTFLPDTMMVATEATLVLIVLAVACAAAHAGFIGGGHGGTSTQHRSQDISGAYSFGYNENHATGGTSRWESGDGVGNKKGSYSLRGADGRWRTVKYVADGAGFPRSRVHQRARHCSILPRLCWHQCAYSSRSCRTL